MERIDCEKEIFGMLFKTSNSLQVYLDNLMKPDQLTAKQMFLMIIIHTFGDEYPTLKDVSEKSSSSYQNVKQLALKLEKEGYVSIISDQDDKRKKRLQLTKKAAVYWEQRASEDASNMSRLFMGCDTDDLMICLKVMHHLQMNIQQM